MENEDKKFLKIKSIRTSSRAYQMLLKENDIILCLDGEFVNVTYEVFSKELNEIMDKKILTIVRNEILFNTFIEGPLGVVCEEISSKEISNLENFDLKKILDLNNFYQQFEVYKRPQSVSVLLNTIPTILASLAPPLWMVQNKLWIFLGISLIFYMVLFIVSPWLFFIGWILKSWYVGSCQIDILRYFYRFNNYRFWISFCEDSEKKAQQLARKFDNKVDFDYSYLEPVITQSD
jgi:hypothetical protein